MQPFETVREQLLKAGIAASHVNRYIVELREHLADLTAKERADGAPDATAKARTLMGGDLPQLRCRQMLDPRAAPAP